MYAVLSGNAVTGNLLSNGIKMTDRKKSYFLHAVKNTDILSYTVLRVFFDIVCNTSVFHNLIYAIYMIHYGMNIESSLFENSFSCIYSV